MTFGWKTVKPETDKSKPAQPQKWKPRIAWPRKLCVGYTKIWETILYLFRLHWLALKWIIIQLFTRKRPFQVPPQKGVAIVTGGSGGIGSEIVRKLYASGMFVIIASSNIDAAHQLKSDIVTNKQPDDGSGEIHVEHLDLRSFSSIRDFAVKIIDRKPRLKLLINNAGVLFDPCKTTCDGFETTVQVNYLGPFLLTYCLLPLLKNGGTNTSRSRVINVSSVAHYASNGLDLDIEFKNKNIFKTYVNSKLMQILNSNFMNRMMQNENSPVIFVSVHPGIVDTNLYRNVFYFERIRGLVKILLRSPAQAANDILFAALAGEMEYQGGTFSGYCRTLKPHPECLNEELQRKLWNISCELLGLPENPKEFTSLRTKRRKSSHKEQLGRVCF